MPDFTKLRQIPVEHVCALLGMTLKKRGGTFRAPCPICAHSSQRAFSLTVSVNRWWCFGHCRNGGDGLELYARVRQMTKYDAAQELAKHFNSSA